MVQEMGAFTQKCGFPCIKSENGEIAHNMERANKKERREGKTQ